jgi:hypothetical protein
MAQGEVSVVRKQQKTQSAVFLTGNVRVDLFGIQDMHDGLPQLAKGVGSVDLPHRSPWLAAGMSLVVPGSGELYAGSVWKAAAFFVVDVGLWVMAYHYDHEGDRQTDFFQNYADQHWSVVQYGQYTETNLHPANGPYLWLIPNSAGMRPWQRVNWAELNRMESDIGGYYSHNLPPYGQQQYYELIGKYPQFNQGWDDANLLLPPDYETIKANLTERYLYYAGERGQANVFYDRATTFVTIAIVNHILSAVDAAWTAHLFNNNVHVEMGSQLVPADAGYVQVPVLKVRVTL